MITRGVTHRYPFLLKLPKDLPCTFNGTYGYVSYKLVVFIRKPFREMYIGATKGIQVAPILDLNDLSVHLQLPVHDERKYYFSTRGGSSPCYTENEVISMKIRLPKTAFVPDHGISFDVEVDNRSNLNLGGARVIMNAVRSPGGGGIF